MTTKKDKKDEIKPLDMTTDEAMEYLFGQETARKLKEIAHGLNPPPSNNEKLNLNGKSTQE